MYGEWRREGRQAPSSSTCSVFCRGAPRLTLSLDTNTWRTEAPRSQTVNDIGAPLLRCESELLQVVDSLDAAQVLGYQVPKIETVGELRLGGARFLCSGKCFLTIYFSCGALASCALCAKTNLECRGFCGRGSFTVVQRDFFVWFPCADVSSLRERSGDVLEEKKSRAKKRQMRPRAGSKRHAPDVSLSLNPALMEEPVAAPLPVMYKTQVCTMTHLVFVSSAGTAALCSSLIVVTHVCSVLHDGGVCSLDHVLDPGGLWQGRMLPGQVQKPRSVAPIDVQVPWIRSPDAPP